MKPPSKVIAKSFKATLERPGSRLGWTIVRIPFDVHKTWGTRGLCKVKGEINGFVFRTSLFPTGKGDHFLMVNKKMQAGGSAVAGTVALFRLVPDTEVRIAIVPADLKRVLGEDRELRRWFDQLNYSTRKWIGDWITQVKSAEARVRRAQQVAEQMMSTMEAERELPPVLQVAFAKHPRAREGWERMSVLQRRGHLLAIFYYRSPEARARRVAQAVEASAQAAEKSAHKSAGRR
jgi:uncharacterized protein YdeI (YjbR/CyaY-like superfamily)